MHVTFSSVVFVEEMQRNIDCSPKIYIIERLRKMDRGTGKALPYILYLL
jgi:hypothetical protein